MRRDQRLSICKLHSHHGRLDIDCASLHVDSHLEVVSAELELGVDCWREVRFALEGAAFDKLQNRCKSEVSGICSLSPFHFKAGPASCRNEELAIVVDITYSWSVRVL